MRGIGGGDNAWPRAHVRDPSTGFRETRNARRSGMKLRPLSFSLARRCFNRLDLPAYSRFEKMKTVLTNVIAVEDSAFSME